MTTNGPTRRARLYHGMSRGPPRNEAPKLVANPSPQPAKDASRAVWQIFQGPGLSVQASNLQGSCSTAGGVVLGGACWKKCARRGAGVVLLCWWCQGLRSWAAWPRIQSGVGRSYKSCAKWPTLRKLCVGSAAGEVVLCCWEWVVPFVQGFVFSGRSKLQGGPV